MHVSVLSSVLLLCSVSAASCLPLARPQPALASATRIVWLLWFQGWNAETPWLVNESARSWEAHNPGWEVQRLCARTLSEYLVNASYLARLPELVERTHAGWAKPHRAWVNQASSDVVRVHLLSTFGGVWADATLLCTRPLDGWLPAALASSPASFFAFKTRRGGGGAAEDGHAAAALRAAARPWEWGPCVWFLAAAPRSHLVEAWRRRADDYWLSRLAGTFDGQGHGYLWLEALFEQLLREDAAAARDWAAVSFVDCATGPHLLGTTCHRPMEGPVRTKLYASPTGPPAVLKLAYKRLPRPGEACALQQRGSGCVPLEATAAFEAVSRSLAAADGRLL